MLKTPPATTAAATKQQPMIILYLALLVAVACCLCCRMSRSSGSLASPDAQALSAAMEDHRGTGTGKASALRTWVRMQHAIALAGAACAGGCRPSTAGCALWRYSPWLGWLCWLAALAMRLLLH
jgi:hypothetical protein